MLVASYKNEVTVTIRFFMLAASYKNEVTVTIRFFYVSGILQK